MINLRKLKIIRKKSIYGSIGKVKIYMACDDGDFVVNEIKCKQVGTLKNGKEIELDISNDKVLLIALTDKMTKDVINDKILILEGNEDLTITGSFGREEGFIQGVNLNVFRFDEGIENTQKI